MGKVLILFSLLSLAFGGVPKNRFNICDVIDCGETKDPLKSTTPATSTTVTSGKETNLQQINVQLVINSKDYFSDNIFMKTFHFPEPIGRKG